MKSITILVLALCLGITAQAQKPVALKLNLEKGKAYHFLSKSDQTVNQTMQGMQQSSTVNNSSYFTIKMMESTPDFMVAEIKFDSILTKTTGAQSIEINSNQPGDVKSSKPGEVMSYFMNRFCSTPIYAKIQYDGKVKEIINLKLLEDNTLKDIDSLAGPLAPALKPRIMSMLDAKAVQTMIESITAYLPDKEIKPGDSWNVSLNMVANGMGMLLNNTYKLNGVKNNVAEVTGESSVEPASSDPIEMSGAKITNNLRGLSKLTMSIDTKTGLLISSTGKSHIEGTLGVEYPGGNMNMPMQIDGEFSILPIQ